MAYPTIQCFRKTLNITVSVIVNPPSDKGIKVFINEPLKIHIKNFLSVINQLLQWWMHL